MSKSELVKSQYIWEAEERHSILDRAWAHGARERASGPLLIYSSQPTPFFLPARPSGRSSRIQKRQSPFDTGIGRGLVHCVKYLGNEFIYKENHYWAAIICIILTVRPYISNDGLSVRRSHFFYEWKRWIKFEKKELEHASLVDKLLIFSFLPIIPFIIPFVLCDFL